jgi:hypothetical protein
MGANADFWVGDFEITSSRNEVNPALMSLFRANDRRERRFGDPELPAFLVGQWTDGDDELKFIYYEASVSVVRDRLELEGYTIQTCRQLFEEWRELEAQEQESWKAEYKGSSPAETIKLTEQFRQGRQHDLRLLRELTADKWMEYLRQIIAEGLSSRDSAAHKDSYLGQMLGPGENFYGYGGPDPLVGIRLAMEVLPIAQTVTYDMTELVMSDFIDESEDLVERQIEFSTGAYHASGRVIILTEGRTDVEVLKPSLELLFPHLAGYYSFMDFAEYGGGAGQLANLTRAFAGAGIVNRVIALFDNDAAAAAAIRSLRGLSLPKHMVVMRLPDFPMLRSYPTLGPTGSSLMDINGMAASIELYLGLDALRNAQGELPSIQWTGFERSVRTYQGELLGKKEVQERFMRKLEQARQDIGLRDNGDWSGLHLIFAELFKAFHAFDLEQLRAQQNYFMHASSIVQT